jgi:hypothetical protein
MFPNGYPEPVGNAPSESGESKRFTHWTHHSDGLRIKWYAKSLSLVQGFWIIYCIQNQGTNEPSIIADLLQDHNIMSGLSKEERDNRLKELAHVLYSGKRIYLG